jgi:hypothetical protein
MPETSQCSTRAEPQQLWRVPPPIRHFALAVALFFLLLAFTLTAIGITVAGAVLVWIVCLGVSTCVWRLYLLPYVALHRDGVVVQGAFAEHTADYASIRAARPGLYGLVITTDAGAIVGWAVQKSAFSEWFHRRTLADDIAAEIMDRAGRASSATR